MKAKLVDSMLSGDWIYEIKFDGYRALALRGGSETRILSRNQEDPGSKFPEVKDSIAALDVQDAVIDGEIVALNEKGRSSFQLLQDCGYRLLDLWHVQFNSFNKGQFGNRWHDLGSRRGGNRWEVRRSLG